MQHERQAIVARTGGGGLTLIDNGVSLDFRAELDPEDPDGKRAIRKVSAWFTARRKLLNSCR